MKIQVRRLIDIRVVSGKKKKSGDCESVCSWCRRGGPGSTVLIHGTPAGLKSPSNSQPSQSPPSEIKWSGAYGIRTRDLLNAIEALYQLS
jgi:hypothetical protein